MLGFLRTRHEKIDAVRAPTALSLLLLCSIMVGTLALPKRPEEKKLHASELVPLVLQPATPGKPINLHGRLVTGLKARMNNELRFVDKVVYLVDTGKLPETLVDQTFFWARQKTLAKYMRSTRRHHRPIIYFRPAMVARAARIGVKL